MVSKGEIDIEVVTHGFVLRLRALVVDKLQAVCFGGTNFHLNNKIRADIDAGTLTLHGQYVIEQSNQFLTFQMFPESEKTETDYVS